MLLSNTGDVLFLCPPLLLTFKVRAHVMNYSGEKFQTCFDSLTYCTYFFYSTHIKYAHSNKARKRISCSMTYRYDYCILISYLAEAGSQHEEQYPSKEHFPLLGKQFIVFRHFFFLDKNGYGTLDELSQAALR